MKKKIKYLVECIKVGLLVPIILVAHMFNKLKDKFSKKKFEIKIDEDLQ